MPTIAREIRRLVIEHSYRAHVGHIGSSLSIAEILAALYGSVLKGPPGEPDRDRLVLSKGHAALGLFAALVLSGRLDGSELDSFGNPGSRLGVHPEPGVPGVDFGTGSLGQGLSIGAGVALAARLLGRPSRAFVVLSDAELNEGSVWESAQFAGHHRLRNLVAVVDLNGQQAFGNTADVLAIKDPAAAFAAFGWEVVRVDGHDERALADALDVADHEGPPRRLGDNRVRSRCVVHGARAEVALPAVGRCAVRAGDGGARRRMRAAFVETLTELATEDERIVLLTGDLGFMALEPFREAHPDRFFNVGVAEQNLMGLATGLADSGFTPTATRSQRLRACAASSSFATGRCGTTFRCASSAWAADSSTARPA